MAETDFGALSGARKKLWANQIWAAGRDASFLFSNNMIGKNEKDMNSPFHRVTELTKTERGDQCVMQLVADLQGDGIAGDGTLEGNEEALSNEDIDIQTDQLRNAVKSKGRVSEQKNVIRFRAMATGKLKFWLGDKIDELMFLTIAGRAYSLKTDGTTRVGSDLPNLSFAADVSTSSANRVLYAGTATSEATLTASDKMSWNLIVRACAFAKRKKVRPIRSKGKEYFLGLLTTEQARDLKQDSDYKSALQNAGVRGDQNPIFKGALAVVDGVILYEHNKTFNTLGLDSGSRWGSTGTIHGAQAMLLGAQAGAIATIGEQSVDESDSTDYGNKNGIAYGRMVGMLKPQFKSIPDDNSVEDFGVVSLKTAAAET